VAIRLQFIVEGAILPSSAGCLVRRHAHPVRQCSPMEPGQAPTSPVKGEGIPVAKGVKRTRRKRPTFHPSILPPIRAFRCSGDRAIGR